MTIDDTDDGRDDEQIPEPDRDVFGDEGLPDTQGEHPTDAELGSYGRGELSPAEEERLEEEDELWEEDDEDDDDLLDDAPAGDEEY